MKRASATLISYDHPFEFSSLVTTSDENPAVVTNTADSGAGSLRAALQYAKSTPSTTIRFNIPRTDAGYSPATGVFTINLLTALDTITTNGTVIDGSSQTVFGGNSNSQGPEIQLLGLVGDVNPVSGGFGSVIYGFKIENGLQIEANNCSVNGLILNNFKTAIYLSGGLIQSKYNTIRGCYIGTDYTGNAAMPNLNNDYKYGISLSNSSNNTVGGVEAGQGNRIAYANIHGVNIAYGTSNSVRGNAIFQNGGLGINLDDPTTGGWVTANDANDSDTGSNELQNFPVITHVLTVTGHSIVWLSLNSVPNKTYAIDVYRQYPDEVDFTGYGEGKTFVGTVNLTTDATGNGVAQLDTAGIYAGESYTATATDPNGNTSEFSFAFSTESPVGNVVRNTNDSGYGSLRAAINYVNGNPTSTITFNIPTVDNGYNAQTGVYTIRLASPLPDINGAGTVIDGDSQTLIADTNKQGPEIELTSNGYAMGYGNGYGLKLGNSNSTIKGLIINGFRTGVGLASHSNKVLGCYIGTDATGTIDSPNNHPTGSNTSIYDVGVELIPSGTVSSNHQVGGIGAGEGNRIAFATRNGVTVDNYIYGNSIRGNSIFKNGALGIDLAGNGVTPNDVGDVDIDSNGLQNFPYISAVRTVGNNTQVVLSLYSIASKDYAIDIYRSPLSEVTKTGYGEGKTYAGTVNIRTSSAGYGTTTATIAGSIDTDLLTATATSTEGNTSEFSFYNLNNGSTPLTVINTANDGIGSLRKAIQYANGNLGGIIRFSIPTSDSGFNSTTGVWTISPITFLPQFSAPIVLEGASQPGSTNRPGPKIELSGAASTLYYGLITSKNSVIRGLIINGYSTPVLLLGGTTIESCYIGTDSTGAVASPRNNGLNTYQNGLELQGEGNIVGGDTPAKGNIIGFTRGNANGDGVYLYGSARTSLIRNNTILRNAGAGIGFDTRNFGSQNTQNVILNNNIRDNAADGIRIPALYDGNQNTIRFNSIYNNGKLGIDLGADGVTPNDVNNADVHTFPNHGLNQPVLTGISASGSDMLVTGTYNSRPNSTFEIDFYSSPIADASGYGEGQTFLSTVSVKTDASGNTTFSKLLTIPAGSVVSAIATLIDNPSDSSFNGDTSEFSNSIKLTSRLRLGSATYTVNENAASVAIKVSRIDSFAGAISVNYATSNGTGDPALAGSDYTSTSGTLTWADGDSADKLITIPIMEDALDESDENFKVTLSAPGGGAALGTPASAAVTIVDNDASSVLSLSSATYSVNESVSAAVVTVNRTQSTVGAVSVNYATTNGVISPAQEGIDYTKTSGTLNWANGDGSSKTITIPINNDILDENDETFKITLSRPGGGAILGLNASAVVTIIDNDTDSVIKFKGGVLAVDEGASVVNIPVVRQDSSTNSVSVNYATTNSASRSATVGSDYTAASGTLTWADGDKADKIITIPIVNDLIDEGNESFIVTLSSPSAGATLGVPSSTTVLIVDNDLSGLSIGDAQIVEGDAGVSNVTFPVTLSYANVLPVTVNYATTAGATSPASPGTDYLNTSGTLNFAPGETSKSISVAIVGDKKAEPLETFRVVLSNQTYTALNRNTGIGTILDNDSKAAVSISDVQVQEGDSGTTNAVFTVKLATAIGRPITVKYTAAKGTATLGTDFLATPGHLTFPIGETVKTISVPVKGDTIDEPDEQFTVKLSSPVNATLTDATGVATIKDDDASPTFIVTGSSVREGNKGKTPLNFVISLNRASSQTVKITYQTAPATTAIATVKTDYTEIKPKVLSFKPGETSKTVAVSVVGDTLSESDERVGLRISTPVNATISANFAEGIILNDDATTVSGGNGDFGNDTPIEELLPTLSIDDTKIIEGNSGTSTAVFTIRLSKASERQVSLSFTTANVTATAGSDYESKSGNLSFAPGETSKTVSIIVKGDKVVESDEQFKVMLSRSINATLERVSGIGTITNDDVASASISRS